MRPTSIIWFERLFLLSLGIALLISLLQYDMLLAQVDGQAAFAPLGLGPGFVIGVIAISLLVPLLLWYFIARRASNLAKWILVLLTAAGLLYLDLGAARMWAPAGIMALIVTALQVVAIALLFRADARAWLNPADDDHAAS
ncbi:hypothetical protein N6L26_11205 [Qipengyuania sp. SS22]|uniref:hypothetical protein n=1 Tax=Qipengyuania sp. SS22 TaxID=2979461 RepID=UPI0021E61C50|nr:hypothetical protein [Qipengyuania sp. SS22]UYH54602.1 hypothetical protein N6L26_11205 [Qipengyuania sp. SS22]